MATFRIYCERQDALVIGKLKPKDTFFFVLCAGGLQKMLQRSIRPGERFVMACRLRKLTTKEG